MKKLYLPATCALLAIGNLQAAVLLYEPFDYSPGDLSTNSGTWSDTGSTLEAGSLTYGTLPTAGNRVTMSDDTSWISTGSTLDGHLDNGDTLWFSALVNTRVGTNPDFAFGLTTDQGRDVNNVPLSNSGSGIGFRIKGNNGGLNAVTWSGGTIANGPVKQGVSAGTTYLVVGEIIFGAASDTINLYLPAADLTLGAVVATRTASVDQSQFDTITFHNKAASPRDQVDEIRFGETSDDVLGIVAAPIPEPSSTLLLGLGALLGLGIRRRR